MKYFSVVVALLVAQVVSAQDWAKATLNKSPRHQEWVTVKHGDRSVETFVVYPESNKKTPVVLIIHEIFGMTDWVQDLADQVAAAGYIAVAPDLLSGMGPNGGRSSAFDQSKAMEAVSHLESEPGDGRPERRRGLCEEDPCLDGQAFCGGILLGRRAELPVRDEPSRSFGRICFLRRASG